jgi:signal peptidase I
MPWAIRSSFSRTSPDDGRSVLVGVASWRGLLAWPVGVASGRGLLAWFDTVWSRILKSHDSLTTATGSGNDMATANDSNDVLPGITPDDDLDIAESFPSLTSSAVSEHRGSMWSETKSLVRDVLFAAVTAILIVVFIIQPVKVEGTSMLPHLHDGERIFVNKFVYALDGWPTKEHSIGRSVERGDIVVFWYPNDPNKSFIKRVIGVPGDTVRIDDAGSVFINGQVVEESYLSADYKRRPQPMPATTVKDHYYFVMGDNRDHSNDSRSWGLVPEKYIYGEACFRYWPLNQLGSIDP